MQFYSPLVQAVRGIRGESGYDVSTLQDGHVYYQVLWPVQSYAVNLRHFHWSAIGLRKQPIQVPEPGCPCGDRGLKGVNGCDPCCALHTIRSQVQ